jgi:Trypsin-co-occurring domain 1
MPKSIPLISVSAPPPQPPVDRGGGEPHGVIKRAVAEVARSIPYEDFATQLESVIGSVQAVADRLKADIAEYSAEEITIGLAVSGEGTIGVATVGVEASIQVTLKRRVKS